MLTKKQITPDAKHGIMQFVCVKTRCIACKVPIHEKGRILCGKCDG